MTGGASEQRVSLEPSNFELDLKTAVRAFDRGGHLSVMLLGRVLINAHAMSAFGGNSGRALLIVSISEFDPNRKSGTFKHISFDHPPGRLPSVEFEQVHCCILVLGDGHAAT